MGRLGTGCNEDATLVTDASGSSETETDGLGDDTTGEDPWLDPSLDVPDEPDRRDPYDPYDHVRFDVGDPSGPGDEPTRPKIENLLFISIDDLNDYIGFMGGHPNALTPNLDSFARGSVAFMNAHCAAPSCNPSRTSVMTGRRPSSTGIYRNEIPWFPILGDVPTIPSVFHDNGFRTLGAGKLFHGNAMQPLSWSDYFPAFCDARPHDPSPDVLPANGIPGSGRMDWGPLADDSHMGDDKVTDWVIDQFSRHDGPTFFGCGIFRPHLPWYVPLSYFDLFFEEDIALPPFLENDRDDTPAIAFEVFREFGDHERIVKAGAWREAVHGYLASVAFADAMFGRVIDALDASPLAQTTAVILWSDHGWHLGEKLHWRKFTLWEEATRVPLMVRLPGFRAQQNWEPVSLIDIFPTLVELFDLPAVDQLDGTSLMPLILDPQERRAFGAVTTWDAGNHSVRTSRLRYTRYLDGSEELYDHSTDPHEWTNLASDASFADVIADLAKQLPEGIPAAPSESDYLPDELGCEVPDNGD